MLNSLGTSTTHFLSVLTLKSQVIYSQFLEQGGFFTINFDQSKSQRWTVSFLMDFLCLLFFCHFLKLLLIFILQWSNASLSPCDMSGISASCTSSITYIQRDLFEVNAHGLLKTFRNFFGMKKHWQQSWVFGNVYCSTSHFFSEVLLWAFFDVFSSLTKPNIFLEYFFKGKIF